MSTPLNTHLVRSFGLLLAIAGPAYGAAPEVAQRSAAQSVQPAQPAENAVKQPDTDRAMSSSGAMVPGQPIRPEGAQEATVPKTRMDKNAANSADVGTNQVNDKSMTPGSGGDGSVSPNR